MAKRRMFSAEIVGSDAFTSMPLTTQALYFHLGMVADDDGFVSSPRRTQRSIGASDDDLNLLIMKRFILVFDSGVIVIKHWKLSNYIQKDRYKPTLYKEEKATLFLKPNGIYTDHEFDGAKPAVSPSLPETNSGPDDDVSSLYTEWIHRIGKDRIGKDRVGKVRIGKVSLGKVKLNNCGVDGDETPAIMKVLKVFNTVFDSLPEAGRDFIDRFTARIYEFYVGSPKTPRDAVKVCDFITVPHEDGDAVEFFADEDRADLLIYAFDAASAAGKRGDWRYIEGILNNMAERGVENLHDAVKYDIEREVVKT